jgi:hypothetical protein
VEVVLKEKSGGGKVVAFNGPPAERRKVEVVEKVKEVALPVSGIDLRLVQGSISTKE